MENMLEDKKAAREELTKENLRIQKTAYIKQQMERQRAAEDARLERLLREQEVIADLRESIDDGMWQTKEIREYNREFQEHLNMQIYEAHGITEDKLTGMKEYRNALYRGAAAVLFLLSLALTVLCGVLHGFASDVCLLMLAYTAVEGALAGKKQKAVLDAVCKVLYILIFPGMMVMFVCYELGYEEYGIFLPYAVILGGIVTIFGTISYFLHNPYRHEKRKMQDAKSQIRDIEKTAGKEIRKNQKIREKEERRAQKRLEQEKSRNQKMEEKAKEKEKAKENGKDPIKSAIDKVGFLARFKKQNQRPVETESERTESERTGLERTESEKTGLERTGLERTESERTTSEDSGDSIDSVGIQQDEKTQELDSL